MSGTTERERLDGRGPVVPPHPGAHARHVGVRGSAPSRRPHGARTGPLGGRTYATIEEGASFASGEGHPDFEALADEVVAGLPDALVYLGFSFGVMQAQRLAQTRGGAAGAVLVDACVPITGEWAFGPWPDGVPVQIHGMDSDEFFAEEGDIDAARDIVDVVGPGAELFVYPGDRHLFADSSLPSYDAEASRLLLDRVLVFLDRVGA